MNLASSVFMIYMKRVPAKILDFCRNQPEKMPFAKKTYYLKEFCKLLI